MISSLGSYGGSDVAQQRQKLFSKADANGDASLSKDELLAALKNGKNGKNGEDASAIAEKLFSDMDKDQDGAVSQSEFTSFTPKFDSSTASTLLAAQQEPPSPPSAEEMLAETDSDGDGAISKEELAAVLKKHAESGQGPQDGPSVDEMFSAMDGDGDGSVSSEELTAFAAKGPQGPPPGGGAAPASASAASSSSSTSYDPLDTNKDGVVSLSERQVGLSQSSATTGNLSSSTLSTLLQSINEIAA